MTGPQVTDVAIVGGGPAGLAVGIGARQHGLTATVVERLAPPIDKVCGEGLMPEGVALLERLGVDPASLSGLPFAGIEFIEGETRARARFRGRAGLGVRRPLLHAALVRRAQDAGVDLRWGQTVRELRPDGIVLEDGALVARWIVGADGMNSVVRRALDLEVPPVHRRIGMRRHYAVAPWSQDVQVHWSSGCEAYVTPIAAHAVCVAILSGGVVPFERALDGFPELSARLRGAPVQSEPRWSGTAFRRARQVAQGRFALVGDASGSVDAVTGQGVTLALQQAALLARCLAREDLPAYAASYRRLMRRANAMTSFMLAINDRSRLRHLTLHTLSAAPWLFQGLLAIHGHSFSRAA